MIVCFSAGSSPRLLLLIEFNKFGGRLAVKAPFVTKPAYEPSHPRGTQRHEIMGILQAQPAAYSVHLESLD
jgi:hypothetical protein